ncbi:hypothetical protein MLP_05140 [Microlunatus phosphovorus NM-1]|uniref:Uncharacterized protein n=1 Tax=Microlunatus phosphovorus (strain ATCC 700054 / DSM 10555 / JCM 9379 / NBRC 101784 / NCIMB 13414 / VKM Ac-1990 / NM-1) TaxID=1032480 RepID=F5XK32_MICPN|nr:hypothetical protein MLP_05140 [Microlunatus phosphovorus NM-1]
MPTTGQQAQECDRGPNAPSVQPIASPTRSGISAAPSDDAPGLQADTPIGDLVAGRSRHSGHPDIARELVVGRTWNYAEGRLAHPVARAPR